MANEITWDQAMKSLPQRLSEQQKSDTLKRAVERIKSLTPDDKGSTTADQARLGNRTIVISTPRMPYMGHLGGWNTSGITELLL